MNTAKIFNQALDVTVDIEPQCRLVGDPIARKVFTQACDKFDRLHKLKDRLRVVIWAEEAAAQLCEAGIIFSEYDLQKSYLEQNAQLMLLADQNIGGQIGSALHLEIDPTVRRLWGLVEINLQKYLPPLVKASTPVWTLFDMDPEGSKLIKSMRWAIQLAHENTLTPTDIYYHHLPRVPLSGWFAIDAPIAPSRE